MKRKKPVVEDALQCKTRAAVEEGVSTWWVVLLIGSCKQHKVGTLSWRQWRFRLTVRQTIAFVRWKRLYVKSLQMPVLKLSCNFNAVKTVLVISVLTQQMDTTWHDWNGILDPTKSGALSLAICSINCQLDDHYECYDHRRTKKMNCRWQCLILVAHGWYGAGMGAYCM